MVGLIFDALWRAALHCLHPRVMALSALPLLLIGAMAAVLGYFYWDSTVASVQATLESVGWLATVWQWLQNWGASDVPPLLAPLLLVAVVIPLCVIAALLLVGLISTPLLVHWVGTWRFAALERKKGASFWRSLLWMLGSTLLAVVALVVSMPLWLIPPLVLVLPPLIWGWLTYRVMAFDALAEHADAQERHEILTRYRGSFLLMGIVCGYLGAAPGLVWASGIVFAAAFVVLIPLAVWIYTVVFAFSSLWFTHFSLAALQQLRQEQQAQQRHSGHLKPSRSEYEDATVIRLIHDHESTHHE